MADASTLSVASLPDGWPDTLGAANDKEATGSLHRPEERR
jgi:hypothetical protein